MNSKILTAASLAALGSTALGQGLSLNLNRHRSTTNSKSIVARDTHNHLSFQILNQENFFSVDLTVGTPPQKVIVQIDTGSSDLWIASSENPFCLPSTNVSSPVSTKHKRARNIESDNFHKSWTRDLADGPDNADKYDCSEYGVFDSDKSSTFERLKTVNDFYIVYQDFTYAEGYYFTDEFLINNVPISGITAALATSANSSMAVLGVGYVTEESSAFNNDYALEFTYPNFPVSLKNSGIISKISYSLFLNSEKTTSGTLLFGAVDHSLYTGQLYTVPLVNVYNPEEYLLPFEFDVLVDGVGLVGWSNHDQKSTFTQTPFPALLDSGTTLTGLPPGLADVFADAVGAVWDDDIQWYYMECPTAQQRKEAAYVFDFNGVHIYAPVDNFVFTGSDPNTCFLGAFEFNSGSGKYNNYGIIGDVVLTAMYVVYDLEDYEVSIAQANYIGYFDVPDIEEIVSTVPGAIKAPGYCSTWNKWAPITLFAGEGEGMFTNSNETNPWSTTVTTPVITSETKFFTSSSTSSAIITGSSNATSAANVATITTFTSSSSTSNESPVESSSTPLNMTNISVVSSTDSSNSISLVASTLTKETTTVVTITSCDDHTCTTAESPVLVSVATTTVNGVATEYTTYCPLTANATKDTVAIVTVTSCDEDRCITSESPALVSVITSVTAGKVTEYTTYCPLTAASSTDTSVAPATTESTDTPVTAATSASSSTSATFVTSSGTGSAVRSTVPVTQSKTSSTLVTVSDHNAGVKVGHSLVRLVAAIVLVF